MTALNRLLRTSAFRLAAAYAGIFGAALILAAVAIFWAAQSALSLQHESVIAEETAAFSARYRRDGAAGLANAVAERSAVPAGGLYLVADDRRALLAGNLPSVSEDLWNAVGWVRFVYRRQGVAGPEERLAMARVSRLEGGLRLLVGRDIEDMRRLERELRGLAMLTALVMAVLGFAAGLLMSRRLLRRVGAMTDASARIMQGDLAGRIPATGSGDELDRLAHSLNAMLDRIEQLMAGLREVSDNIAHDLKTPLNRLRNRAEAALRREAHDGAYREALQEVIEESDGLIRIFDALLSIARLEAGARGNGFREFDLGRAARDAVELYEPLADENGLRIVAPETGPVPMHGEPQLISQALANLLDNAIKYAAPVTRGAGGEICLEVAAHGSMLEIAVADQGPGVAREDRERALQRFVRLETGRARPGSGLGLSLVSAVARLHGGEVRLEDNHPGLRVVMAVKRGSPSPPSSGKALA